MHAVHASTMSMRTSAGKGVASRAHPAAQVFAGGAWKGAATKQRATKAYAGAGARGQPISPTRSGGGRAHPDAGALVTGAGKSGATTKGTTKGRAGADARPRAVSSLAPSQTQAARTWLAD